MIVCICRRVSDRDIVRAAQQGLDFEAIRAELGVGQHCGSCTQCACAIVAQCQGAALLAALQTAGGAELAPDVA